MQANNLPQFKGNVLIAVLFLLVSASPALAETVTFTYDALNRLTSAAYGTTRYIEYTYDSAGNITRVVTQSTPQNTCAADTNDDCQVNLTDLVNMKTEFLRDDCNQPDPCLADCNGDDHVNLSDLVIMKSEFLKNDCCD